MNSDIRTYIHIHINIYMYTNLYIHSLLVRGQERAAHGHTYIHQSPCLLFRGEGVGEEVREEDADDEGELRCV